jgi:4-hydroxy-tetrahydrodipicolinate reductase
MLRVAVPGAAGSGAAGRMGGAVVRAVAETEGLELVAAIERPDHPRLGEDAGAVAGVGVRGVAISGSLDEALAACDVAIDFTSPAATAELAERAAARGVRLVVGTTGLGPDERRAVEAAAARVPVVMAANFSVGVNVLLGLLRVAARALGDGYDVEIVEAHHRQKRDAPSGTALRMAEAIAAARGLDLAGAARHGRSGDAGPRPAAEIGLHAVRGGDVVGDHTAHFLGAGERVEITHRASSRETFARGAVRAALWLDGRGPGLFDMEDVLGLRG